VEASRQAALAEKAGTSTATPGAGEPAPKSD